MDVLALEAMVMIQPACIDQRDIAFTVAGDDLLGAGSDFLSQLGEASSDLVQGDDVFGLDGHGFP